MTLDDVTEGDGDILDEFKNMTVAELIQIHGEEPVRRGLSYMLSLEEADRNYRDSADSRKLDEGWEEAYDVEDVETEASKKWEEVMEEEGLGINE